MNFSRISRAAAYAAGILALLAAHSCALEHDASSEPQPSHRRLV